MSMDNKPVYYDGSGTIPFAAAISNHHGKQQRNLARIPRETKEPSDKPVFYDGSGTIISNFSHN